MVVKADGPRDEQMYFNEEVLVFKLGANMSIWNYRADTYAELPVHCNGICWVTQSCIQALANVLMRNGLFIGFSRRP
jgi:hypothetical protein